MTQSLETAITCGDGDALVTYLYGESTPAEREAMSAHLAGCRACAQELAALGGTRRQLASWTPPERALDFRITQAHEPQTAGGREAASVDAPQPAKVLRPAAWWKQPLPAWAQLAAAVAIFASGLAIGANRTAPVATNAGGTVASPATVATTSNTPATVTHAELTQLEQRLRGEMARLQQVSSAPAAINEDAVMQRVRQLIATSESRQQKELDFRTAVLATDLANARRIDNANFEQRLRGTNARVMTNQQTINSFVNSLAQPVGYTPASAPFVP